MHIVNSIYEELKSYFVATNEARVWTNMCVLAKYIESIDPQYFLPAISHFQLEGTSLILNDWFSPGLHTSLIKYVKIQNVCLFINFRCIATNPIEYGCWKNLPNLVLVIEYLRAYCHETVCAKAIPFMLGMLLYETKDCFERLRMWRFGLVNCVSSFFHKKRVFFFSIQIIFSNA